MLLVLAAFGCSAGEEEAPAPAPEPAPAPAPASLPAPIAYRPGRELCRLANREVEESSGVAASSAHPGVFWTHNDSGGRPVLYAFNEKGEDLGAFRVADSSNTDWEDVCSFRAGDKSYLLAADTGDNARQRRRYELYICEEPESKPDGKAADGKLKLVRKVEFTYADGQSYDGESVAAEPGGRRVFLASRDRARAECRIFVLELYEDEQGSRPADRPKAREIARHPWRDVTAMDISRDGQRAMLQTYSEAYQFVRAPGQTWEQAFQGKPTVVALPRRQQGEGLAYGPDSRTLYLTSESSGPCPVYVLDPIEVQPGERSVQPGRPEAP
jgi:hypothetical protein